MREGSEQEVDWFTNAIDHFCIEDLTGDPNCSDSGSLRTLEDPL